MPSMTREEALTKLAMELATWNPLDELPHKFEWVLQTKYTAAVRYGSYEEGSWTFHESEWLAERERLINKPSWDDAPEDAKWLAQHANGAWDWFTRSDRNPTRGADGKSWVLPWCKDAFRKSASKGTIPAGHDWRTTLERRPYSQKPALSEECMNSAIGVSDGSTASYYELPEGATELQHLISHRNMNAQDGEIFRAIYRKGMASHSDELRDAKKVLFYAKAEVERLEKLK